MSGHHSHSAQLQNSTSLVQEEKNSHHDDHLVLCIVHIIMAVWACLANCSQIFNVLLKANLRLQPKNILVVNVCVIELVIGAFLCPLYSESLMQGTWRLDVNACITYEVIFYIQVAVSTLSVMALVVERFYYIINPNLMNGSKKWTFTAVLLTFPWMLGSALVVPMFMNGATATFNEGTSSCQVVWKQEFQAITVFISFFCPAFLVLTMAAAAVMLYVICFVTAKNRQIGPTAESFLLQDSLHVVLLSSLLCVVLQFPFFIVLLMEIFCQKDIHNITESCGQSETTWAVAAAFSMLKPGLMPLTWLAYTDIRNGFGMGNWSVCKIFRANGRSHKEVTFYPTPWLGRAG
uniref:G-protein coupled receptors family 1 profile domain-containing protein n=1 Tax=Arion vulgaris TaxID=1028688 RepID=A0A0B7A0L5_9EUPU